ncbi:DUF742 domain-containing protein [Kutzneria sp. CA-103260]|uniref:DUF742 domain-containing protein n=1 Tax=Kutzneria sp. CA-103260 TaxID=2802641 RepID=UPI001BA654BF|nr:DUF742 domain-containing protein [Kutzneria sp. CA-103260]
MVEVGRTGARFGSARNRGRWADVEPDVPQREPETPEPEEPGQSEVGQHELAPEVGRTGARFGSSRARWRWQRDPAEELAPSDEPPVDDPRFDELGPDEPGEALSTQALPMPPKSALPPLPAYPDDDLDWDDLDGDEEPSSLVRPYARTGGRTEASRELRLETLISVRNPDVVLVMEHRRIVELCEQTRSVAEVAAALPAPLGVARVLIDDLIELGVLTVFTGDSRPDEALLARVLAGLRRL